MTILNRMGGGLAVVANTFFGGERKTAQWMPATDLCAAAAANKGRYDAITGGEFFAKLGVFVAELDRYNEGRIGPSKLKLVRQDVRSDVLRDLQSDRNPVSTLTLLGGLGLQRMGRVHPGHFFRDADGNTGFAFGANGRESRYVCAEGASFNNFAQSLVAPSSTRKFEAR